jgi:hypothetical protein
MWPMPMQPVGQFGGPLVRVLIRHGRRPIREVQIKDSSAIIGWGGSPEKVAFITP